MFRRRNPQAGALDDGRTCGAMCAVPIDAALARRLVSIQFPDWAGLSVRPVASGGHDNRTFRLGNDLVLRLPSEEAYAAQVAVEQEWLPRLAPHLPVAIPRPVAMGRPTEDYPWPWSVYEWLPGRTAAAGVTGPGRATCVELARALAGFLVALRAIDTTGAPPAGARNFHRGGRLDVYDAQARRAIAGLGSRFRPATLSDLWEKAVAEPRTGPSVWVHGDVAPGNVLVRDGRLAGVIDFGQLAVGDPACDGAIAWTFFDGPARQVFRQTMAFDPATWSRARGWALWKAAILTAGLARSNGVETVAAETTLGSILEEA